MIEHVTDFAFDRLRLAPDRRREGISAYMRLRNEEEYVALAIESHLPFFDEIVAVYNRCTDGTPQILADLERRYPDKLTVIRYEPHVYPQGSEKFKELPDDSPYSLTYYYNFALSQTTCKIACKVDGDHIAIPQVFGPYVERIRQEGLASCRPIRGINLARDPAGRVGVRQNQPFTAGEPDCGCFPVSASTCYRKKWPHEGFRHNLRIEPAVVGFYHCKLLKADLGQDNYDLKENSESYYWPIKQRLEQEPPPMVTDHFLQQHGLAHLPRPEAMGIR